jgi:cyclase
VLRPRIIPCLLVHDGGLVKTVRFASPKYVGDPLNAVRIFNEKEVDELMVLDIDATARGVEPDYGLIARLAAECRMPLCYGGGVRTVAQVERLVSLGVEKVAVSSAAVESPDTIAAMAASVGSQSVVVVLDVAEESPGDYRLRTHNATRRTGTRAVDAAREMERRGAGEIVINSIDRDGTMGGYDFALTGAIWNAVKLPITTMGGAGSLDDIRQLIARFGLIGAGAGSLFVFKGVYRAVLINYPRRSDRDALVCHA